MPPRATLDPTDGFRVALQVAFYALKNLPEWGLYEDQVETALEDARKALLNGTKDEFEYNKGIVHGIERIRSIPRRFSKLL